MAEPTWTPYFSIKSNTFELLLIFKSGKYSRAVSKSNCSKEQENSFKEASILLICTCQYTYKEMGISTIMIAPIIKYFFWFNDVFVLVVPFT